MIIALVYVLGVVIAWRPTARFLGRIGVGDREPDVVDIACGFGFALAWPVFALPVLVGVYGRGWFTNEKGR